jgi:hypothetical protein
MTALTLAGAPTTNTSMEEVVVSLRRTVVVSSTLAEAEVDFAMIPRTKIRPRVYDVPTGAGDNATFEVQLQDRELSRLGTSVALLIMQSGTVTLIPATTETDSIEVPPDEIHYNAPTIVSCERFTEVYDSLCVTPRLALLFVSLFLTYRE